MSTGALGLVTYSHLHILKLRQEKYGVGSTAIHAEHVTRLNVASKPSDRPSYLVNDAETLAQGKTWRRTSKTEDKNIWTLSTDRLLLQILKNKREKFDIDGSRTFSEVCVKSCSKGFKTTARGGGWNQKYFTGKHSLKMFSTESDLAVCIVQNSAERS